MSVVRAKFYCQWREQGPPSNTNVKYTFQATTRTEIPENARYHKYTPCGQLVMHVDNPNVSFAPGQAYYVDIYPADLAKDQD